MRDAASAACSSAALSSSSYEQGGHSVQGFALRRSDTVVFPGTACMRAPCVVKPVEKLHSRAGMPDAMWTAWGPGLSHLNMQLCIPNETGAHHPPGGWRQQLAAVLTAQQWQPLVPEAPTQWSAAGPGVRQLLPWRSLQDRGIVRRQLTEAVRDEDSGVRSWDPGMAAVCHWLVSEVHCRAPCSAAAQCDGCAPDAAALPVFEPVAVTSLRVIRVDIRHNGSGDKHRQPA